MRCAVYARVSTELDSQRTSIDNQIDIFTRYAAERNWEIVNVYQDKKSGTKENRPGLKKLIEDGKNGTFDLILAKELSRLARNGRLSYELRDICQHNDLHIICLDNSINTLEGNVQNFGLFAWLYENESATSSRRNKQAKRVKAQRGLFVGSNPPYGYTCQNGRLEIREGDTPNIVRRIFHEYISGKGMDSISKSLTTERVPTPSKIAQKSNAAKVWHASSIKAILNNQHYTGNLVQNRTETISVTSSKRRQNDSMVVLENTHEPIIAKDIFQTVQTMIKKRTRAATAPQKHLFTNMMYCEECSKGMWFKKNQKGYHCGGNTKHGNIFCQNTYIVREKELEEVILKDLRTLFETLKEDGFVSTLVNKLKSNKKQTLKELDGLQKEEEMLRNKKMEYVNLYTDEVISQDELKELRELTNQKIQALQKRRVLLEEKLKESEDENHIVSLKEKLKDVLAIKQLSPSIIHTLIDKITCKQDGEVLIQYSFINPLQSE